MARQIITRTESGNFCPYHTPLLFANNTSHPSSFQWVATAGPFITGSYADRHPPVW